MTYDHERPCALGGRMVVLRVPDGWMVGHEPSGATMTVPSCAMAVNIMDGVAMATTAKEANGYGLTIHP